MEKAKNINFLSYSFGGSPFMWEDPSSGQGVGSIPPPPRSLLPSWEVEASVAVHVRAPMPPKGTTQALSAYIRGVKALS